MDFNKLCQYVNEEKGFIGLLGVKITEIDLGYVKAILRIQEKHKNPMGLVHGGCVYTLADTVAGMAADTHGEYVVTLNSSFNFLAPAKDTEVLIAEAKEVRYGHRVSVYDVKVYNEREEVLGTGTFHLYNTKKSIES